MIDETSGTYEYMDGEARAVGRSEPCPAVGVAEARTVSAVRRGVVGVTMEDAMKTLLFGVLMTIVLGMVATLAHADEQYVGVSNVGAWSATHPMDKESCQQFIGVMLRAFMDTQLGEGDLMSQMDEIGLYKVRWNTKPPTSAMFIFKCVPIIGSDKKAKP